MYVTIFTKENIHDFLSLYKDTNINIMTNFLCHVFPLFSSHLLHILRKHIKNITHQRKGKLPIPMKRKESISLLLFHLKVKLLGKKGRVSYGKRVTNDIYSPSFYTKNNSNAVVFCVKRKDFSFLTIQLVERCYHHHRFQFQFQFQFHHLLYSHHLHYPLDSHFLL